MDILEFYEGDSKEEFNNLERSYIEKFDSINPEVGYNRTLCCGGGFLGEDVYKKRFYRHSEEAKRKISIANKGKVVSKETIEKMRKANLGKVNNNCKKKTIEERKKRVISRKRERPVLQYDLDGNFIREWESICEAGRFYGLCYGASSIKVACDNPNRTCKGFKWKYKETKEEIENIEIVSAKRSYEVKHQQTERCHPIETRPLTVREYARIQTFPDDWKFAGNMSAQYKQIGNAVPVNLSYAIGRSLIRLLNDIEKL